jgi:hypothetical protein
MHRVRVNLAALAAVCLIVIALASTASAQVPVGGNRGGGGSFTKAAGSECAEGLDDIKGATPYCVAQAITALAAQDPTVWVMYDAAGYAFPKFGTGAPTSGDCDVVGEVGRVYARTDGAAAKSTFYVCGNTGSGTYAWELLGGAASNVPTVTKCTTGTSTSATTAQPLGSVDLPAGFTGAIGVKLVLTHAGGVTYAPQVSATLGASTLSASRTMPTADPFFTIEGTIHVPSTAAQYLAAVTLRSTGAVGGSSLAGSTTEDMSSSKTLTIRGQMSSGNTTESVTLENYCVTLMPTVN